MKVCILDSDATLTNALSEGLGARDIVAEHRRPPSDGDLDAGSLSCDLIVLCQQDSSDSAAKLIRDAWPTPIAILLQAADTSNVMQAARLGAIDACDRNAPPDLIVEWIGEICARERKKRSERLSRGHYRSTSCPAMTALQRDVERVAQTDSTVLIAGETGTGKELAAREVHRLGKRADRAIVTVNCAAIPDTLIESELFGYEKGAFTGATSNRSGLIEAADGGTLFLDEIGELPLAAQARLLRYIQEGEIRRIGSVTSKKVDARLICATHRNLRMLADSGQFREDLFYRIDVLRLDIPALRERGADIVDMAEWLIERQANKLGMMTKPLSQRSLELLGRHRWPGNVRELQNVIERALVMSTSDELELTVSNDVATTTRHDQGGLDISQDSPALPTSNELSLEDYFQRFVLEHQDAMNETELAQKLGISRKCLWERRQRFGLPRQKQKSA